MSYTVPSSTFFIVALFGALAFGAPSSNISGRREVAPIVCGVHGICANEGKCVAPEPGSLSSFACVCPEGFTGERCQERVNYCDSDSLFCQNSGSCIFDSKQGAACQCHEGFGGARCEVEFNLCMTGYCKNGGSCRYNQCYCRDGYAGRHCEISTPKLMQYEAFGCSKPEFCRESYRNGICDPECNSPQCFYDGFDCEMDAHGIHKFWQNCTLAMRNGVGTQRNPQDEASTQSQQAPWSILISAAAFLLVVLVVAVVINNRSKTYGYRKQAKVFRLSGPNGTALQSVPFESLKEDANAPQVVVPFAPEVATDKCVQAGPVQGLDIDVILKAVSENKTDAAKQILMSTKRWCLANGGDLASFVNASDWQGVYATNKQGQNALIAAAAANHPNTVIVRMVLSYMIHNSPESVSSPSGAGRGRSTREYFYAGIAPKTPLDFKLFTDVLGRTAMHYAAINGNVSLIGELSLSGFSVNSRCQKDETPIFMAIRENHKAAVETLITLGATLDYRSAEGYTPIDIAERTGNQEILEILRDALAQSEPSEMERQRKRRANC
ncbi:hypothetical protein QR680_014014 [Steinernema hermaphroditum]|uniref:Uncharacterized protein n=1 Tax=Steinernema hermaphroditum TaxID=289476 RepID=A0AA39M2H9_9BILA|nr:hypothetical protein QR680_014014 [Steinernema hermaphroditum]